MGMEVSVKPRAQVARNVPPVDGTDEELKCAAGEGIFFSGDLRG